MVTLVDFGRLTTHKRTQSKEEKSEMIDDISGAWRWGKWQQQTREPWPAVDSDRAPDRRTRCLL